MRAAEAVYRKVIEQYLPVGTTIAWEFKGRHTGKVLRYNSSNDIEVHNERTNDIYWITIDDIIRAIENE